jgi:hypothetical protein
VNFVGDGAARKPVLFNPIPDVDASTAAAAQDAEIDSEDEDTRPYKCTHCNKGPDSEHIFRHFFRSKVSKRDDKLSFPRFQNIRPSCSPYEI